MPRDPLHDAVHVKIEATIEENYRGADGSYPVAPHAVATLASLAALAAIEEEGYVIVPVPDSAQGLFAVLSGAAPQPSGAIQDCEKSGDGTTGPIGHEKPAASLSDAREEILRKHLDIVVRTRAASHDGSKLTPEARDDFVDQLIELYDMSEKGELV